MGLNYNAGVNGIERGMRMGLMLDNAKGRKEDRAYNREVSEESRGYRQNQEARAQETHTRNTKAFDFGEGIKQRLYKKTLADDEMDALKKLSVIEQMIQSNLPPDKKAAYMSRVPDYLNTLHGAEMNESGPSNLEQRFSGVEETQDGLMWQLENRDKKTGKKHQAYMTWGRSAGGEDVAVQPWDHVYQQVKAYREVAQDLGIYDPALFDQIVNTGIGGKQKKYSDVKKEPVSGMPGQFDTDNKFHPVKQPRQSRQPGGRPKAARLQVIEAIKENAKNPDGSSVSYEQAVALERKSQGDPDEFVKDYVASVMADDPDKGYRTPGERQAMGEEAVREASRLLQTIQTLSSSRTEGPAGMGLGAGSQTPDADEKSFQVLRNNPKNKTYSDDQLRQVVQELKKQ